MLNVVILGAPGSGKGTQSELIIEEFGLEHISTGEVLRAEIKNQTQLGIVAGEYINRGHLVPDNLIIDLLSNVLDNKKNTNGIIFDGFPRTIPQAEALNALLNERGTNVSVMLNLEVAEDELINRLLERGERLGRADDNLKTIRSRLGIYHLQTAPLIEYYKKENILHVIKGVGTIENIFEQIKKALYSCQTL